MRLALAVCLFTLVTAPALAKDLCLTDGSDHYVFTNVKLPKPGRSAPLIGQTVGAPATPITGTMTRSGDGTKVFVGIVAHGMIVAVDQNGFTAVWTGDPKTLAGSGRFDNTGDLRSDGDINFSAVDCKTIVIP